MWYLYLCTIFPSGRVNVVQEHIDVLLLLHSTFNRINATSTINRQTVPDLYRSRMFHCLAHYISSTSLTRCLTYCKVTVSITVVNSLENIAWAQENIFLGYIRNKFDQKQKNFKRLISLQTTTKIVFHEKNWVLRMWQKYNYALSSSSSV